MDTRNHFLTVDEYSETTVNTTLGVSSASSTNSFLNSANQVSSGTLSHSEADSLDFNKYTNNLASVIRKLTYGPIFGKLAILEAGIFELEKAITKQKLIISKTITIQNLRSKKIQLKSPLYVLSEFNATEDMYVISSTDLNIWGHGDTEQQAIADFCSDLESFYFELKNDKKNLGKDFMMRWKFIKEIIKKR